MRRRTFLGRAATATAVLAGKDLIAIPGPGSGHEAAAQEAVPWYRRATRWGQTNITEMDPRQYDLAWWRGHWKKTRVQGIIVNAGGIVAYYPSRVPWHRQAQYLGGRDLFGEICRAAHEQGLAVMARMDSNRAHEELYRARPGWFAVDASGEPIKAGELFVTCVNGPYYEEQIPAILTEIAQTYQPDGFTDNSWSGLDRDTICYCANCRKSFRDRTGLGLPASKNWDDPAFRQWIRWSYGRRIGIWELNNRTTRRAGGPHCVWSGMNSGSIRDQARTFRDLKEICSRADILMLDNQARSDSGGFQANAFTGKLAHGLLGWDKLAPESMAMYQAGRPTFRVAAKPSPEARMWMIEGVAGGIQPWWHYVGSYHEDRRIYKTAVPFFEWHAANERYLIDRQPAATVGVVWSQHNVDFYGRDDAETLVDEPLRGVTQAMIRARIPFIPVHADHIGREAPRLAALVLPNLGILTGGQAETLRQFAAGGGGILATGETSLYDEWGDRLPDYGLADLLAVHSTDQSAPGPRQRTVEQAKGTRHTYLRLAPELRGGLDGPRNGQEPAAAGARHLVLKGLEETDIVSFGGVLGPLNVDPGAETILTFIPEFPIYPPETAWMRVPRTGIPGLVLRTGSGGGRIAFLPADLDRRYAKYNLPDHGTLIANLVRWVSKDNIPLVVDGHGLIDCHLYRQEDTVIIHIVNLTSAGTWRQPVDEFIPVGPLKFSVKVPEPRPGRTLRFLVSGETLRVNAVDGWYGFTVRSITDHEVVVIG